MYHELSDVFNNAHVQFMLNEKSNSYFCVTLAKAGVSSGYTTFLGITIRNTNHRHLTDWTCPCNFKLSENIQF